MDYKELQQIINNSITKYMEKYNRIIKLIGENKQITDKDDLDFIIELMKKTTATELCNIRTREIENYKCKLYDKIDKLNNEQLLALQKTIINDCNKIIAYYEDEICYHVLIAQNYISKSKDINNIKECLHCLFDDILMNEEHDEKYNEKQCEIFKFVETVNIFKNL